MKIDKEIYNIDKAICSNISTLKDVDRGLLSQNILQQFRTLIEHIALKIYANGVDVEITYPNLQLGIKHISSQGSLKFLNKFHEWLQRTNSHYILGPENSERIMLKYYEHLFKVKKYLKDIYNFDILDNLCDFPINTDSMLQEYYMKIAEKIEQPISTRVSRNYKNRYYIQKIKPFFVKNEIYYEVTFTSANDRASKFDRVIAFTKLELMPNYSVKLTVNSSSVLILNKSMPILIIDDWRVSIRPCELNNFARIFNISTDITGTKEYYNLMSFMSNYNINLVDIIDLVNSDYVKTKDIILKDVKQEKIFHLLDLCRDNISKKSSGSNVIRYLLFRMNNKIIKRQYSHEQCYNLSNLCLKWGCVPFDQMPFDASLVQHNPRIYDLLDCLNTINKEHEFFAKLIKNNVEIKGQLYTPIKELEKFGEIEMIIKKFNDKLYYKHRHRKLGTYKDHVFITGYEEDTLQIIQKLIEFSNEGIDNFQASVTAWISNPSNNIDCEEKKIALENLYNKSKVALIYGAAGTGKSTFINHISHFLHDKNKLYLAKTNPAVDNLRRKVLSSNCEFMTIDKFISPKYNDINFDLLVIDECSTVSNSDMLSVLRKVNCKLLLLVGDIFQIESIHFGNWFNAAKYIIPSSAIKELTRPYRSTDHNLLNLWHSVRNASDDIFITITKYNFSTSLDESIFGNTEDDEIILCLNYDGLYGINNINRFLQCSNSNKSVIWGVQEYKIGDPVLFNETDRFANLLYNNLKGKITDIELLENKIRFDIEIYTVFSGLDVDDYDLELIESKKMDSCIVRFYVYQSNDPDYDNDSADIDTIVPFQVAYAVSIHKAQGLEYKSVKLVITNETEEMITHNIFYTAITRAKEYLKIYWSPETQHNVLSKLECKFNNKDVHLLKSKYSI